MIRAVLAVLLATSMANAETLVIEPGSAWSDGGYVRQYLRKRDKVDSVQISGRCVSSCAVFLSHDDVCVARKARFGFHALSYRWSIASPAVQQDFTNYLGSPELGEWFLSGPAKSTRSVVYLSGDEMIDVFGFPECV